MKRLLLALALLCAPSAFAQESVQGEDAGATKNSTHFMVGGWRYADSLKFIVAVDGSGRVSILDARPDRDANIFFSEVFNDTMSKQGNSVDSTENAIDTHDVGRAVLLLKAEGADGAAGTVWRVAVQIRGHSSSIVDSAGTYAWDRFRGAQGATGSDRDSIGTGVPALGTATSTWSSEFLWKFVPQADLNAANGVPGAIAIQLEGWWAPFTTVRFRVLSSPAAGSRVRIRGHLVGTPLCVAG